MHVDAEECWTQLTHALKDVPGLPDSANRKFVEQFMTGEITRVCASFFHCCKCALLTSWFVFSFSGLAQLTWYHLRSLKSDEAPEEQPSITVERVLKIECNITANTNYMHNGILNVCPLTEYFLMNGIDIVCRPWILR